MSDALQVQIVIGACGVMGLIVTTVGGIAIAYINGRVDRLKDAIEAQHDDWMSWSDEVLAEIRKLPGGPAIIDRLPPRPRPHLRKRGDDEE